MEAEALDAGYNNYLAAVTEGKSAYGLAVADVTTGNRHLRHLIFQGLDTSQEHLCPTQRST